MNGFSAGEEDSGGPSDQQCCLMDDTERCNRPAGNASYSKRIQKIVTQRRLRLNLDPGVGIFLADYQRFLFPCALPCNLSYCAEEPTWFFNECMPCFAKAKLFVNYCIMFYHLLTKHYYFRLVISTFVSTTKVSSSVPEPRGGGKTQKMTLMKQIQMSQK